MEMSRGRNTSAARNGRKGHDDTWQVSCRLEQFYQTATLLHALKNLITTYYLVGCAIVMCSVCAGLDINFVGYAHRFFFHFIVRTCIV